MLIRILFIVLFLPPFCLAQKQYQTVAELPITAQIFSTDKLQHYYAVDSLNQIRKYTNTNELQFEYTNNTLGRVGALDATDPFNIVVFYPDYQTVTFLDRTLTETQRISLLDAGFFDVKTIGLSRENQLWLYDGNDFRLKRIDQAGDTQQQSDDLTLVLGESPEPSQIQAYDNKVYVNVPQLGILVFDIFGNYLSRLDFKKVKRMQVIQNQLLLLDNTSLYAYHLKSKLTHVVLEEVEELVSFQVQKGRLYLHKSKYIRVLENPE